MLRSVFSGFLVDALARRRNDRPEEGDAVILIGAGEYHETVQVTRKGALTLLVRLPKTLHDTTDHCDVELNTYHNPNTGTT